MREPRSGGTVAGSLTATQQMRGPRSLKLTAPLRSGRLQTGAPVIPNPLALFASGVSLLLSPFVIPLAPILEGTGAEGPWQYCSTPQNNKRSPLPINHERICAHCRELSEYGPLSEWVHVALRRNQQPNPRLAPRHARFHFLLCIYIL
jgi:hypothetical protein